LTENCAVAGCLRKSFSLARNLTEALPAIWFDPRCTATLLMVMRLPLWSSYPEIVSAANSLFLTA